MLNKKYVECLIGFDGYIDEMYSVVQNRSDMLNFTRYGSIEEFGQRIISASNQSADIEIYPIKSAVGGNAPILANALATLGYETACVGQMDCDYGENMFEKMHPSCQRISVGQASRTIALEFADGKIMLGNLRGNSTGWEDIKQRVGINRLNQVVRDCRVIGIVNWSGMFRMNEIIRGLLNELLMPLSAGDKEAKDIFLDLADPTARSPEDREELFELIKTMSAAFRVTLGMNENEARKISKSIGLECCDISEIGKAIHSELGVYQVVVHTNQKVFGFKKGQTEIVQNMHVKNPVSTTGAGDHFNAGFCMGILENKSMVECMVLGQAMASSYISEGVTVDRNRLADYIRNYYEREKKENE